MFENQDEAGKARQFFKEYKRADLNHEETLVELIVANSITKITKQVNYYKENIPRVGYESVEFDKYVTLNPKSFVFREKPKYLCYNEAIIGNGDKIVLNRLTVIEDLSVLEKYDIRSKDNKTTEVDTPLPTYLKNKDRIMFFAKYVFGPKLWELP